MFTYTRCKGCDELINLKNRLVVSCQALKEEPLHSSFIMGRMALAAKEGGAGGIRANTKEDILEIKKNVDLPIIGIVKAEYKDSEVYITPTIKEIKEKYPELVLMADCSTYEEALHADELGFDFIGTTLVGYTEKSKGFKIHENDFELIRNILSKVKSPVIAEGNINTPKKARRVLELGCYSVVVGSIITRPQLITKGFTKEINKIGVEN